MTKKRTGKSQRPSPKPRASRVGSGNSSAARHPIHKAREIRSLGINAFVGWSIYPEQLPAMRNKMAEAFNGSYDCHLHKDDLDAMLRAIGLVLPNIKVTNTPAK